MAATWPKIIRDPIHDVIIFRDTPLDRLLLELINCREFQRLRRIKQLGFSEMIFPGANHSRFAHSIGVLHLARRFLGRIEELNGKGLDDRHRNAVLVAGLLHDVGHGPFSHAFEKVTGNKHEKRTREIILNEETEINAALRKFDPQLPRQILAFFDEADMEDDEKNSPRHLARVISSQFDADRCDYLLRDSHATGTEYGRFDLQWMLDHLYVDESNDCLYLSEKAYHSVEKYIFARHHMYQSVYFHKTTRAAEVMFSLLLKRFKQLSGGQAHSSGVPKNTPPLIARAFGEKLNLGDYLQLDDHTMTEFFKACEYAEDQVLSRLASGILHRRFYKCIDVTAQNQERIDVFRDEARKIVEEEGLPGEYLFVVDAPGDNPYKPYQAGEHPSNQILVETAPGRPRDVAMKSDLVSSLRKRLTVTRYYFPAAYREAIHKLGQEIFQKGH